MKPAMSQVLFFRSLIRLSTLSFFQRRELRSRAEKRMPFLSGLEIHLRIQSKVLGSKAYLKFKELSRLNHKKNLTGFENLLGLSLWRLNFN